MIQFSRNNFIYYYCALIDATTGSILIVIIAKKIEAKYIYVFMDYTTVSLNLGQSYRTKTKY